MPQPAATKSPVEYCRPEYHEALPLWERIRATMKGEDAVKLLGDKIVPRPNPSDTTTENQDRYCNYLKRGVFYNVSGRTLDGLTGYVFMKEPTVTLPSTLKTLETNIDGSGVTLNQQAKEALRLILSLGRAGLLVDYPKVEGATTKADLDSGKVSPTIVLYEAEQIVNWRTKVVGAQVLLDLLVLKECVFELNPDDEFCSKSLIQYRVLTLTEEGVQGRIFPETGEGYEHATEKDYTPQDSTGQPLKQIPFTFIGPENNDSAIDQAPLLDLVNLNLAHFRNSCDYEESSFMVGQPTPWVSGVTEQWVTAVFKGRLELGSRAIIPLPINGNAGLLQADANSLPMEAMKHKEDQMRAIGAKLVEKIEVQQTATQASMDHASDVSTLSSCAQNVFLAYATALKLAGAFVGSTVESITYELTDPLYILSVTPEQMTAIMGLQSVGLIDYDEARDYLKKAGVAYKDNELVKETTAAGDFMNQPPAVKPGQPPIPTNKPPTAPVK